jgi:YD repeat-containing protein
MPGGELPDGEEKTFSYDDWGNLSKTIFEDGSVEHRNPNRTDRTYDRGGQLLKTENREYRYDKEGNLVKKKDRHGQTWRYEWDAPGRLSKVKRPDAMEVRFKYDALGRRTEKRFDAAVTRWQMGRQRTAARTALAVRPGLGQ